MHWYCLNLLMSNDQNRGWATKKLPAFRFAHILVIFCLALVCILRRVFEQLVNRRVVTMLRCTRCNIVILMAAAAWMMMSFSFCIVCGFEPYFSSVPGEKDNTSHVVKAIKITMLHRVYLNMVRGVQFCVDAGGNHFQQLL
jgi:hypothetical protein